MTAHAGKTRSGGKKVYEHLKVFVYFLFGGSDA